MDKALSMKLLQAYQVASRKMDDVHKHLALAEETFLDSLRDQDGDIPEGAVVAPDGEVFIVCEFLDDDPPSFGTKATHTMYKETRLL